MRKYLAPQSFVGLNGLQLCLGDLGYQVGWLTALVRDLNGVWSTYVVMLREGVLLLTWLFLKRRLMRVLGASFSYLSLGLIE